MPSPEIEDQFSQFVRSEALAVAKILYPVHLILAVATLLVTSNATSSEEKKLWLSVTLISGLASIFGSIAAFIGRKRPKYIELA